jgi:hypothetical protein
LRLVSATVGAAIIAYGTALVDDDAERIGETDAVGIDEVLFARLRPWRTGWAIGCGDARFGQPGLRSAGTAFFAGVTVVLAREGRVMLDVGPTRYATTADSLSIAYKQWGHGERDVVLVPGTMWHSELVSDLPPHRRMAERLGGFARVLSFDKRGTGLSDRHLGTGSLDDRMLDVSAVMDDAHISHARSSVCRRVPRWVRSSPRRFRHGRTASSWRWVWCTATAWLVREEWVEVERVGNAHRHHLTDKGRDEWKARADLPLGG